MIVCVSKCLETGVDNTCTPKITHPKEISDMRKISGTSDYSKLFEGFLKDWIMEDVSANLDIGQFGGQTGIGTGHMIVCLLDSTDKPGFYLLLD